ncbi:MAG: hypothetical protein JEY99_15270 [Spirochaetales bacterium]|nr:hypothetical protein [Spirochaetales bacterium]
MAEKKIQIRVIAQITNWERVEQKASSYILQKNREKGYNIPEQAIEIANTMKERKYLNKPNLMAKLYLKHLEYIKTTPDEKRKTLDGWLEKYFLYNQVITNHTGKEQKAGTLENMVPLEALTVMAIRQTKEEQRYCDTYNIKMLLEDSGKNILYCGPWKMWLVWDGNRWKKDDENEIYELASESINRMFLKSIELEKEEEERLILMEHASRNKTIRKIEALVRGATWKREIRITPNKLDTDKFLFNCQNGTIDLTCGRLKSPEREDKITRMSPIEYDPDAQCPTWLNFLSDIFLKKKETVAYVQKAAGWCLSGDVSVQAMFILYGAGANGKSTFINTIMKIMGDYAASTPTETFMQKNGNTASNDIARLKGTRFVSAMEAERGMKLAEAIIKRLTGNDAVSARFLYGEYFEFIPTFKIFMATNHKPKIGGMDNAIWRRIKLIPFSATFTKDQQDPALPEKLEKELPGILAWMVEGCLKWFKEGLGEPPEVKHATDEYRQEMSAVESFLELCCTREEHAIIQSSHLYEAYKKWSEKNNEYLLSQRSFSMRLSETGLDKVRTASGYHWLSIKVNEEKES